MGNPRLECALNLAREGVGVIPCKPGQKVPATRNGLKDGTTDLAQIREWWRAEPDANPAACTGEESGMWVLDLDGPEGVAAMAALEAEYGPLPRTRTTRTPRGLHHHFRTVAGVNLTNRAKVGGVPIDVRANGGYALAAGSTVGGVDYVCDDPDAPVADPPAWLVKLVTTPNRPAAPPPPVTRWTEDAPADIIDRAWKYLAKCRPAVDGQGGHNDTFWAARVLLHGFALSEADAWSLLIDYNATCSPPWDERDLAHKLKDAADKPFDKPRGWLRDADRPHAPGNGSHHKMPAAGVEPTDFAARVVCLIDLEAVSVSWLWEDRFPLGRLSLLVGRPGDGKTFVTTEIAARVTTGTPFPDGSPCQAGAVVLLNGEDDAADTLKPRLTAAGADCAKVHVIEMAEAVDKDGKKVERVVTLADIPLIEQVLKDRPDTRLVVVDPVGSYLGAGTDSHRDNEVRGVLAPLAALAKKYNVAVLMVAHTRKSAVDSADDTALGSRAFTGICRAVYHLMRDPEEKGRRLLVPGKSNLARPRDGLAFHIDGTPARIQWEADPVCQSADDVLAATARAAAEQRKAKRGPTTEKTVQAAEWLERILREPKPAVDVMRDAAECGFSERTLQRAKAAIGAVTDRHGFGGKVYWVLPKDGPDAEPEPPPTLPFPPSSSLSEINLASMESKGAKSGENPLDSHTRQVSDGGAEAPYSPSIESADREVVSDSHKLADAKPKKARRKAKPKPKPQKRGTK